MKFQFLKYQKYKLILITLYMCFLNTTSIIAENQRLLKWNTKLKEKQR